MIRCNELTFTLIDMTTGIVHPMDREDSHNAYDPMSVVRMFYDPMDSWNKEQLAAYVDRNTDELLERYFTEYEDDNNCEF